MLKVWKYEIRCALKLLGAGEAIYKLTNKTKWHTFNLRVPQVSLDGQVRYTSLVAHFFCFSVLEESHLCLFRKVQIFKS